MGDIILAISDFLAKFDLGKFIASITQYLYLIYFAISTLLAIKVYKDSKKRISDKFFVIALTFLVFIFNFIGYIIYAMIKPKELIIDQHMLKMEKYYLEYETRGIGRCRVCSHTYFPEHTFCTECGSIVRTKCNLCGNIIELDWNVCPYCGDKKAINNLKLSYTTTNSKRIAHN